jgi:hypothetical protein
VLLDHPELQEIEERVRRAEEIDTSEDTVQQLSLTLLNTDEGTSGETFNLFLHQKIRDDTLAGTDRQITKLQRRDTAQKKLDSGKRVTAGLWAASGRNCIDTDVLDILRRNAAKRKADETATKCKKDEEDRKYTEAVRTVIASGNTLDQWNCNELKLIVQLYKKDSDKKLPSQQKAELLI